MELILLILLSISLFINNVPASSPSVSYDEVNEFKEILKEGNPLAVLFTEECCSCTNCVEAEVLLGSMSHDLEENLELQVVRMKKPDLRSRYGVKTVPSLVYIRDQKAALYDGVFESDTLYSWLQENREPATIDLTDDTFEHLTQASTGATTGDWLVLFHDGSCSKNKDLLHLENAGVKLRGKINVALINTEKAPVTAKRFKITACPEIIFFRHQKMYRFSLPDITVTTLKRFAMGFYKNSKAENVPLPATLMDRFRDTTKKFYTDYWYGMLVALAFTTVFTTSLLICTLFKPSPRKKVE